MREKCCALWPNAGLRIPAYSRENPGESFGASTTEVVKKMEATACRILALGERKLPQEAGVH